MAPFGNSLLRDPALAAMGLVPCAALAEARDPGAIRKAIRWRTAWVGLAIAVVALVGVFQDTAGSMVATWYLSTTFNHAFLVPPICGYLIWVGRRNLSAHQPEPTAWGIVLVAVMAFGWLIGNIASVRSVEQYALIGMIDGLFLTVLGWRAVRAIAFPLFYLTLAVPFGEFLIAPLQDLTAVFVVKGLRLVEVPVYLDGIFLSIPAARFEVAEACAGVRFLIATIALGLLFGHLTYRSHIRFAAFMMLSVAVPLVANWFRALGIVYLAHITDAEIAIGTDHIIYGWAFFSFVTIVLLAIGMLMREKAPAPPSPEPAVRAAPVGMSGSPTLIAGAAVVSLLIASSAPAYERFFRPDDPDPRALKLNLPEIGGGWRLAAGVPPGWRPSFPSADATLLRTYVKDGRKVQIFIAYYVRQTQGKEVVNKANIVADGTAWYRAANWSTTAKLDGVPVGVNVTRMLRGDRRRLALSWYWVGGSFTNNPYISKLLQIRSRLFGGPAAAAVIAVSTTYEHISREAEDVLRNFLSDTASLRQALEDVSQN